MDSIKTYDAAHAVAPMATTQGTVLSFVGRTQLISGLDVSDANAPGSPPREAPV